MANQQTRKTPNQGNAPRKLNPGQSGEPLAQQQGNLPKILNPGERPQQTEESGCGRCENQKAAIRAQESKR